MHRHFAFTYIDGGKDYPSLRAIDPSQLLAMCYELVLAVAELLFERAVDAKETEFTNLDMRHRRPCLIPDYSLFTFWNAWWYIILILLIRIWP